MRRSSERIISVLILVWATACGDSDGDGAESASEASGGDAGADGTAGGAGIVTKGSGGSAGRAGKGLGGHQARGGTLGGGGTGERGGALGRGGAARGGATGTGGTMELGGRTGRGGTSSSGGFGVAGEPTNGGGHTSDGGEPGLGGYLTGTGGGVFGGAGTTGVGGNVGGATTYALGGSSGWGGAEGGSAQEVGGNHSGGEGVGGGAGTGQACAELEPSPLDDLVTYQEDIVGRLSGMSEISDGVILTDRATPERRETVRRFLEDELVSLGYEPLRHDYGTGVNVYTMFPAGDAMEYTLLGAHYDSVAGSPGANDNATGVALVLGVARALSRLDCRTTSVIFAFFDQEEDGMIGSDAFALEMSEFSSKWVAAGYTADQIGWDSDGDRAVELEQADAGLYDAIQASADAGGFAIPLSETDGGDTDHVALRARGIPSVGLCEEWTGGDSTPYYHEPTDTWDTVKFDYLASTTALITYHFARLSRGY